MENVLIEYKSLFKGQQNESVEYKVNGLIDGNRILFEANHQHIEIIYSEDSIILINNESRLSLNKLKTLNYYKTQYGDLMLYTKLINVKISDTLIGFKYELYDETLITTVYTTIKLIYS